MTVAGDSRARAAYDRWHEPIAADEISHTPWHRLLRRHLDLAADVAGRWVLEIGCGRGSLTRWLIAQPERPARLVAADFSETALRKASAAALKAGLGPVHWKQCDIQALPFRDASFDTVISCETIEHVPDPARAVREMTRVLRPGGRLLLTTPNYLGPLGLYRGYLRLTGRRFTETGQPINRFTMLPVTRAWARRAGLEIERVDSEGHYVPWPGRRPAEIPALAHPHSVMRWFGLHSIVVAHKPGARGASTR